MRNFEQCTSVEPTVVSILGGGTGRVSREMFVLDGESETFRVSREILESELQKD